jgi:hypothetical protein
MYRMVIQKDLPAPYIRTAPKSSLFIHVVSYTDIFRSMISAYSARQAVHTNCMLKELQDCVGTVVVVEPRTSD